MTDHKSMDYGMHQPEPSLSSRLAEFKELRDKRGAPICQQDHKEDALLALATELAAECEKLRARVEELEKDAARWNWSLTQHIVIRTKNFPLEYPLEFNHAAYGADGIALFNSNVDAAIAAAKDGGA